MWASIVLSFLVLLILRFTFLKPNIEYSHKLNIERFSFFPIFLSFLKFTDYNFLITIIFSIISCIIVWTIIYLFFPIPTAD